MNLDQGVILLRMPQEEWYCPNGCYCREWVDPLPPGATRYHNCPRLHDLSAPLVRVGTDCAVEAVERDDFLNGETQATGNDGKAYMAVITKYADGRQDVAMNAGLATAKMVSLWVGHRARSGKLRTSRCRRSSTSVLSTSFMRD